MVKNTPSGLLDSVFYQLLHVASSYSSWEEPFRHIIVDGNYVCLVRRLQIFLESNLNEFDNHEL